MSAPVPADLLRKYGTRGPRYTSYPTAPHFTPDVDRAALHAAWTKSSSDLSFYAHLPYCQIRCLFCGCHVKITRRRERSVDYVDRLLMELDVASTSIDLGRPLRQVQLGGGTPNFLLPEQMERFVSGLRARTHQAPDAEWGIECDPRTLDASYVDLLLDLGFNRFSLGVQDLDPDVMAAVNRPQSIETVEDVVAAIRSRGPISLNLDLIHGLPRQTESSWATTIRSIIDLRPSRLAVYGYAHVPWKARHQRAIPEAELPDPELRAWLARHAREELTGAGYAEIGMDHYALPDDELAVARRDGTLHRNFMGYTTRRGLDLVAIGTSAISHVGASFSQDHRDLHAWEADLDAGRMPWERGLLLDEDDLLRGEIITELSCNDRLDIRALERAHGIDFHDRFSAELERLGDMERDGLLTVTEDAIELLPHGRYLVRNACMVFDAWLEREGPDRADRYSRTT